MCPSDIYQLPASSTGFGPGALVFASDLQFPCSIAVQDQNLSDTVKIQIQKNDDNVWNDYSEGELLIGKTIKCRLTCGGKTKKITIEVFHT